jgi:hypothetical protein
MRNLIVATAVTALVIGGMTATAVGKPCAPFKAGAVKCGPVQPPPPLPPLCKIFHGNRCDG